MELVRFYLYEWGFVCTAFYSEVTQSPEGRPSSQVLLLAVAWLLAFSRFFERQHRDILEVRAEGSRWRTKLPRVLLNPFLVCCVVAMYRIKTTTFASISKCKIGNIDALVLDY